MPAIANRFEEAADKFTIDAMFSVTEVAARLRALVNSQLCHKRGGR